ncbi:hypothetical protein A3H85_02135 [Candidatus Daviesbacteria bacterium RIFCSPLOWO2_02_FULL_40_8]|uniref:methionyl-tRNA formyltransferase n=1 Tax=Candidatus Daviesbacteria bacterium RIFCSPLOWO2_01_FULL_40_24 TaxID=1797787 RepID=A0A1F5MJN1_9BACT|nr:MAG: hypothetical protein A2780_02840 [Candidatus Daviesbacteria bacterium RIFCSPHIGHO2_01_FULL_41_45]OGE35475.1 MAG: hypothetical protein A3C32_03415 [Candidatus Daviesbacteria bacterium RIFCSPHIGHO2_02_FULL_41_14]OGE65565.1 MAG: hypothetical protein A3B49_01995 [Candidatus Daviesbacteria bacterium RIFCSPLOWO2_01_FULL_40_24]OGE67147.1 MAG: hypothetical protein A3H85_02135 [Candidatus Daviesbacteria bacterium RIFCSPLOWO2_02_FULL_40_8]
MAVVTQPPRPVGRKQVVTPSPVSEWAEKNQIPIFDKKPEQIIDELKKLKADVGILESYGEILSSELITLFPHGIINIHPSLLPKYRGSSPNQAVLLNGDSATGITAIKLDSEMDHGPILFQVEKSVYQNDTFKALRERLFADSAITLLEILPQYIAGEIKLRPQDDKKSTYTWKTDQTKAKAYFDINNPPSVEVLDRMSRAFYPWPNAWTKWNGKIVKLLPEKKVQIEGKKPVSLEEFLRGYPDFPIKAL